ncbi:hypothetical protein EDB85DRAFT_1893701 [Lactarius pseudohatsudake]|nr:hypothetical protein EDB85DRAFT_1893701 [Lactarius pseudohatsudake]
MSAPSFSFPTAGELSAMSFTDMLSDSDSFGCSALSNGITGLPESQMYPRPDHTTLTHPDPTVQAQGTTSSHLQHTFASGNIANTPTVFTLPESPAYMNLMRRCQQAELRLKQITDGYEHLRAAHEGLVTTHNTVMADYIKNIRANPQGTDVGSSQSSMSPDDAGHPEETELSQSDYPDTKFWKREAWSKHEKELKDSLQLDGLGHQSGPRGGTRAANRENVMMQYLEEADGTTVSGAVAANIRTRARSIWIHLYNRDLAPLTWGDASKAVQDEYYNNIEKKFKVLRYCKNHWKAQAVATAIYSQWHGAYHLKQSKRTIKAEPANTDEPPTKRLKTETRGTSNAPLGASSDSSQMDTMDQPKAITLQDPL